VGKDANKDWEEWEFEGEGAFALMLDHDTLRWIWRTFEIRRACDKLCAVTTNYAYSDKSWALASKHEHSCRIM